jgi:ceramide glucosyltransferase
MFWTLFPFLVIIPALVYNLLSFWCGHRYFGQTPSFSSHTPPVTIIKPVKGMDAESYENFASFCRQEYPVFQIIFALSDENDPVLPVIRRIIATFPDVAIDLVVDDRKYGPNYKVCNLMNAYPLARHDLIIVCDSDIRVGSEYLRNVCSLFVDPEVGLVSSLYRSSHVHGWTTALEALGFTTEMVPNVMVARSLEGLTFALGASMAVRREALEGIGGFRSLVEYLADDYQLGNRVHQTGWRLELSDHVVESVMKKESFWEVFSRQLRWCRTMRVSRPGGYAGSGIVQPFPQALLALIVSGFTLPGLVAALLLYLVRGGVSVVFSRRYLGDRLLPGRLWLLPVRDCIAFTTWFLSFFGNRVNWRGHRYRVLPGGRMVDLENVT